MRQQCGEPEGVLGLGEAGEAAFIVQAREEEKDKAQNQDSRPGTAVGWHGRVRVKRHF